MRLFRPGILPRLLFRKAIFRLNGKGKSLYLTFDDGPDPGSTPEIVSILEIHSVPAAFFCSGTAAEKFPSLIELLRSKGHIVGNHGYSHLNGWWTKIQAYIDNAEKGSRVTSSVLFRPPYGKILPSQYRILLRSHKIIFWDLMAYDFDPGMKYEKILTTLRRKIRSGSIIVLHDRKSSSVRFFLSEFLQNAINSGYQFKPLPF
jgi:peptidoglycan/xylan/chitin deacetylase (PgdA/CDA1 family)